MHLKCTTEMNSYLIVRTHTLNYMSQNQTEFRASYETPLRFFAIYVTVKCVYCNANVCWKVAGCIWAAGGWGKFGSHRNGIGKMIGRVLFMAAFARWRTWCQDFVVRCRYWISIAGQGIRRANGHQSTVQALFPIHWFHVGEWDKHPFNLYTRTLITHPTAHPTLLSPNNGYDNR